MDKYDKLLLRIASISDKASDNAMIIIVCVTFLAGVLL